MNNLRVSCYSGHTYAERPVSLVWEGRRCRVEVEKEWRGPGRRCFLVRTEDGKRLELYYDEQRDEWLALEIGQGGSHEGSPQDTGEGRALHP